MTKYRKFSFFTRHTVIIQEQQSLFKKQYQCSDPTSGFNFNERSVYYWDNTRSHRNNTAGSRKVLPSSSSLAKFVSTGFNLFIHLHISPLMVTFWNKLDTPMFHVPNWYSTPLWSMSFVCRCVNYHLETIVSNQRLQKKNYCQSTLETYKNIRNTYVIVRRRKVLLFFCFLVKLWCFLAR